MSYIVWHTIEELIKDFTTGNITRKITKQDSGKLLVIDRHKGRRMNYLIPYYDKNKLNRDIHKVLELASIDRMVTVINPSTVESEQHPIYEVASSHMACRTFVDNLYKKVKDPCLVDKLSGHSEHSRAFTRYRDIEDDMVHEMTNLLE